MIKVVKFDDIRDLICKQLKRKNLIPVLGAGFTSNCNTENNGFVPSGDEFKNKMIEMIDTKGGIPKEEIANLKKESFANVSTIFHKIISKEEQRAFLKKNFTKVILEDYKKDFLDIKWPYVYTLNLDDAIETNSRFECVINCNRIPNDTIFDDTPCVIKLHGDAHEIIKYEDNKDEITDQSQYASSIRNNRVLLSKLKNDLECNNVIYLGCSLTDKIDLLSIVDIQISQSLSERFYFKKDQPTEIDKIKLESYGITKCVVFKSYEEMYSLLVQCAKDLPNVQIEEIKNFLNPTFITLDDSFEDNKSYLFWGKSLSSRNHEISLPNFFISRKIAKEVIQRIENNSIQFLIGPSCCGKTYISVDVVRNVRNRDVYYFPASCGISEKTLQFLITLSNTVIILDSGVLKITQIETLLRSEDKLRKNNVSFLVIENKNNRDLYGRLLLLNRQGIIKDSVGNYVIQLFKYFDHEEINILNEKLVRSTLGIFNKDKSIADNIIEISNKMMEKNIFNKNTPKCNTMKEVACLIALATEHRVYSSRMIDLDLVNEFSLQEKASKPLIELETTWNFEISASDNSPNKYIVNADYWLYNQLDAISQDPNKYSLIIGAYRYIVEKLILRFGEPLLDYTDVNAPYKSYILFDNINQIFRSQRISLIREIYENLSDLLSANPNYLHQKAKCYIRSAKFENNKEERKEYLKLAYLSATEAYNIFEKRYNEHRNERIFISMNHTRYTQALSLCHIAFFESYQNNDINTRAITLLYDSLISELDYKHILEDDTFNYNDVIGGLIRNICLDKTIVNEEKSYEDAVYLCSQIINEN